MSRSGRGTLPHMDSMRRQLRSAGGAAAPRGRVMRLELRTSVDMLMTLALLFVATGMAVGYQVFRWRGRGSGADWR